MDIKEMQSFIASYHEVKDSWDHVCFKKCMDTFDSKITTAQYDCLSTSSAI